MEVKRTIKKLTDDYKAGDTASFEELYQLLVSPIFAFVSSRTATRELAKEVVQDSFVELSQSLAKFTYQSDGAFYAFMFTIVRRQLAKQYASATKHSHVNDNDDIHQASGGLTKEVSLSLEMALRKLDEVSQEIIILHHWSRYTFVEIASILNMTESAVRVRHHRAKTELANLLTS